MQQINPVILNHIGNKHNTDLKVNLADISKLPVIEEQKEDVFEHSSDIQKKQINKKKVGIIIGVTTAAVALIGAIIYGAKTGKIVNVKETTGKTAELLTKELKDIKYDKGIASLKENGEKFTGKICDTLKSGDKITLEYVEGVLQKSTRSGEVNFEKVYEVIDGALKVKKIVNGVEEILNIKEIKEQAIDSQVKLKSILENKDKLSSKEFLAQTSEIKFKTKAQKEEISRTLQDKQRAEMEEFEKKLNSYINEQVEIQVDEKIRQLQNA